MLLAASFLLLHLLSPGPDDAWQSVPDSARPAWHPLAFVDDEEVELFFEVAVSEHARTAWLRYGEEGSRRVAVVLDRTADKVRLFVDRDRDRCLVESEALALVDGRFSTLLEAELAGTDGPVHTVWFQYRERTDSLAYTTADALEGRTRIDGQEILVRRRDGDGNGLSSDAADELWIDVDANGVLDPFGERYRFAPVLDLGGTRHAVRSDRAGTSLELTPLAGVGAVRLVPSKLEDVSVLHVEVLLVGQDGSAAGVTGLEQTEVPAGTWRIGALRLSLADPKGGMPWCYVFSESGGMRPRWFEVEDGGTVDFDPVGTLDLRPGVPAELEQLTAGEDVVLHPTLHTQDGLLVNTAYRGQLSGPTAGVGFDLRADLTLERESGEVLDHASSGFL